MFVDVILIAELEDCADDRRKSFDTAMVRRGWWRLEDSECGYRIGFSNAANDAEIVQICERDVQESAYVAGVKEFDATCLIAPDDSGPGCDSELRDSDSRPDMDDLLC